MVATPIKLSLEAFLAADYIEASPAWEYLNNGAVQKPMPKFRHSVLQKRLLSALSPAETHYLALPELRCTFGASQSGSQGARSIVPDIAVIAWDRIQLNEFGEPKDDFLIAPDWSIEILSPSQNANRVVDNLLYCLRHGTQLGWLIDPGDRSILVFRPQQEPQIFRADEALPVLPQIEIIFTAKAVFQWLQIKSQ